MKFIILLTLLTTLNASAFVYSQDAKLNLSLQDKTLREVIKTIENQSNFRFFFSDDYLDLNKKVTVFAQDKGINDILPDLLEQSKVSYKVMENNVIVITPLTKQTNTVSGAITDGTSGEPLVGVSISVKGTNKGVTTDANGKFSIEVAPGEVLMVSYVGYLNQEILINDQKTLNIQLAQDIKVLDEVVVIGYGTVKKKDLTGSVASVKSAEIAAVKSSNPLQALQGKAPGIDLTVSTGQAGATLNINLRGNRSLLANNAPLILLDGVEYGATFNNGSTSNNGPSIDINPSDIESIDVLKDASSTAIYGTRGANGVILITTKKGSQGKSRVSFNSYVSYNVPTFIPKIMNTKQYVDKRYQTIVADSIKKVYNVGGAVYNANGTVTWNQTTYPTPWDAFGNLSIQDIMAKKGLTNPYNLITSDPTALQLLNDGVSLDYLDMILQNSYTDNYELNIQGGNDKTGINLSLGLMNDRGLLRNDILKRYNFKLALDHKLLKNLKVGSNVLFTYKKNLRRDGGVFTQALKTGTAGRLYNDDGTYRTIPDLEFTRNQFNPMLDEVDGAYSNDITSTRIFGTSYMNWEIMKGLTFKTNFGVDINNSRNGLYGGPKSVRQVNVNTAQTQMTNANSWAYTWENTLNYNKKFGKHEIQGLLGNSALANAYEFYQMTGSGQQTGKTEFYDWSFASVVPSSQYRKTTMLSYFGRLNYKFNEKYLFTASLRSDGSSVLSEGKKWGYFPSAAVAWRVNEEDFLKSVSWLSNLKVRGSWGVSGNAAVQPYQTVTQLGAPIYYTFDNTVYSSPGPSIMGNTDVTWETTKTWNAGIDISILNSRINATVDFYTSKTTDLLFNLPLPPSTSAYTSVLANVGSTKGKGMEINVNTLNAKAKNFEWSTDFNLAVNRDEVLALNAGASQVVYNNNQIFRVGSSVQSFYDYAKLGIYQVSDLQAEYTYIAQQQTAGVAIDRGKIPMISNKFLPGDIKIKDVNGDGIFDDKDKVLYNRSPKCTFGISNNISYAGLNLSVMIYGRIGQMLQYGLYQNYKSAALFVENGPMVNAWSPSNTGGDFPMYYTTGNGTSAYNQSLTYLNGSYVKIKDITLSYSLPKMLLSKVHISSMKIYVTGKNLFTFSGIDNYDPEVGGSLNFPLAKQYIVGMNLDF